MAQKVLESMSIFTTVPDTYMKAKLEIETMVSGSGIGFNTSAADTKEDRETKSGEYKTGATET